MNPVTRAISSEGSSVRQGVDARGSFTWRGRSLEAGTVWNHARLHGPYADAHDDHHHGPEPIGGPPTAHDTTAVADENARAPVPGVADYTAFVTASGGPREWLLASASLRLTGPYVPIGEPEVRTDPYAVLDLGASIRLRGVWLDLDLQNVFDAHYPELRASGFVNPGSPRVLRATLRFE
jgi:hypothetical protein